MAIRRVNRATYHMYYNGSEKYDTVTSILSGGLPKPALLNFYAKAVSEKVADMSDDELALLRKQDRNTIITVLKAAPDQRKNKAAAKGTEVHGFAEKLITGAPVEAPEELVPYVEQAARFMDQWKVRPVLTEVVVASHKWRYAGTFDLLGELPGGRRILYDYKTSASGIWPETALQLAAYRWADAYLGTDGETEMPVRELEIEDSKAVWLRADGYDVIPLITDERVHRAFLHIQYVARVAKEMREWVLDAEYPS